MAHSKGFEPLNSASEGSRSSLFVLDKNLVKTGLQEFWAFQGWRYLNSEDVPRDLNRVDNTFRVTEEMPLDLQLELKALELL